MAVATIFDRGLWVAPSGAVFDTVAATSTVGQVDVRLTAAAVRVHSAKFAPSVTPITRPLVKGSMGPGAPLIGKQMAQVDIVFELKGKNPAMDGVPEYAEILRACGLSVTHLVKTTTIKPEVTTTTLTSSVDICMLYDGMWWRADNCAGTATIDFTIGNIILVTCSLQGSYVVPVVLSAYNNSQLLGIHYDSGPAIVANNTTSTINDGSDIRVAAMSLDLGNDVQEHYVTGDHRFAVANRAPKVTFTKDSAGTAAEWAALIAATPTTITGTHKRTKASTTAGEVIVFTSSNKATRDSVAYSERAERDLLDVSYQLTETITGNDQFTITIT